LPERLEDLGLLDETELNEQAIHGTGNESPHIADSYGVVSREFARIDEVFDEGVLAEAQGGKVVVKL
jgi:hypothetical protein